MKWIIAILLLTPLAWSQAGTTAVTAQVKDANNSLYVNCQWSVVFVHQNTTPGIGPDAPAALLNGQQGNCDSQGNFVVMLADNINTVTPTPSQWNFSICSAGGYVGGPFCKANMLVTITGASQNLTSFFQPLMPLLPPSSSGGGGTLPTATKGSVLASTGVNVNPAFQLKPIFDVRDFMTCDGATNATLGMSSLMAAIGSSNASINVVGSCNVSIVQQPANVTMKFDSGGNIKLITNTTPPGGGGFVQGSGTSNAQASPTSSCSATLNGTTAGNSMVMMVSLYNTFTPDSARITSVVDGKDLFIQQMQTTLGNAPYLAVYAASSIQGGTVTVTANFSHAEKNACQAWEISGMGPVVATDASTFAYGSTTPFSAGPVTLAAGDFVISVSEDPNGAQTCTAGAGYTQPASSAGNVSSTNGVSQCAQYIASGAGGATSATQNFNNSPVASSWGSALIGLKPGIATWSALGGIYNPDLHQICVNCTGTNGILDFTGNLVIKEVFPEWWGAQGGPVQSAATNTPAMQAAIIGAFGTKRVNGSGANIWNKQLTLTGNYQINAELQFYHIIGSTQTRWQVWCAPGGGITQTASNLRILDGQSNAYGRFDNCAWIGTASSTAPLIDLDFSGAQGADLAPQFIDFYSNSFNGSATVDTGVLIAKSGGAAQGSNIYCYDCAGVGFTGAVWQVGGNNTGRNVGRVYAQNALAIGWYGGDMQNCPLYGFASYGGGYIDFHGTSFECTSPLASYLTSAVNNVDVYCEGAQGPCSLDHVRSEDFRLINATSPRVYDSKNTDQSTPFYSPGGCIAGSTEPLNWFIHGSDLGSDGAVYQVTAAGAAFGGNCLFHASSGTSTSITDTNQNVPGTLTIGLPVVGETFTQATSGSTGVLIVVPASTGTITGSVTSGTIVSGDTMTQATTGVTCIATNAPTGSQSLTCKTFSGTADSSHAWTDGGTGGIYTPSAAPTFSVANPQLLITAATGSPDGTHNWTGGTSGSVYVPSGVPVNEANFAAFSTTVGAQSQVTFWGGTGIGQVCYPITSNTATTINYTQCTSNYYNVHSATADTTTTAIVEPCWQCGNVTTSGNFTFAKRNLEIIGGDNSQPLNAASDCTINHVSAAGGLVWCGGNTGQFTSIQNLIVTRADWYTAVGAGPGSNISDVILPQLLQQVQVERPFSIAPFGQVSRVNWSIGSRNANTNVFSGPLQTQMGTSPLVWSQAQKGGGTGTNDTWIGGRSDPAAGTDTFRNRVEYSGMLGSAVPNAFNVTNQNGTGTFIGGGPSTGSGTPGDIEFWIGNTGSSGTTVNSGLKKAGVDSSGLLSSFDGSFGSEYGQAASACETSFAATTLNTGGTTTDTGLSCLPAGSVIDAVVYRITTTITTAANFTIGDGSTAARFCTTQSTLTAGTTGTCFAQSGTSAQQQAAAAKVRVTTNTNPGAGAIRLIVYYHTFLAPTS